MKKSLDRCEVLAFGAHPDDIELGCSGTICKLTNNKIKVGIIDLTAGEKGSRGSKTTRLKESIEAAKIMNVNFRYNCYMPDTNIKFNDKDEKNIVSIIRKTRPRIVLAPPILETHPDHTQASKLIQNAYYKAGFAKYKTDQKPFRPERIVYYMLGQNFDPSFVVDITDYFDQRQKAISAYSTQFYNEKNKNKGNKTKISSKYFKDMLETRIRFYGNRILKSFGEPFLIREIPEIKNITDLSDHNWAFR